MPDPVDPTLLPIFPLASVVLFPNVQVPLYIFEPRYRQMTADALDGDRAIGMVLLRADADRGSDAPAIFAAPSTRRDFPGKWTPSR